jgi:hypothetical protein
MSRRTVSRHTWVPLAAVVLAAVSAAACSGSSTPEVQPEVIGTLAVDPLHGGTLALPGGPSLEVPVGAVDQAITLRLTRAAGPTGALSARYGFEPAGQVFARPVRVGLPVPTGTAAASIRWSRRGGGFEPIGGAVVADRVVAEVTHFSEGYADADSPTRTVVGSKVNTLAAFDRIYNVGVPLGATTVAAWVPKLGGGWDHFPGTGYDDGVFSVPGVPKGRYLFQVAGRYVMTDQTVLDAGQLRPGRPGLVPLDLAGAPISVSLTLDGLEPWTPPGGAGPGLGDRLDLCSPDANDWSWGVEGPLGLLAGATSGAGTIDLLRTGSKLVPVNALDVGKGDRLFLLQQAERTAPGGQPYQAAVRSLASAPLSLAPGQPGAVSGTMADVSTAASISVDWQYDAWEAALVADANPSAEVMVDRFQNRFRVVGQPGGLAYGTHELISKADLVALPVAPGAGRVQTGALQFGLPTQGDWGAHWIASVDRVVRTPNLGSAFVITVKSMGVLSETVSLTAPGLSLPRLPRAGGQDLFAPTGGVGLTPTISWGAPTIGTADVYSIQIVRLDPGAPVPYTYVAVLDTADTSIELPPGVLETGRTYLAVIRAFSRGVSVAAPLRMQLPLAMAVQVTATFQP